MRGMAGPDAKDPACVDLPVPDYEAAVGKSVKGLRIGLPREYFPPDPAPGLAAPIAPAIAAPRPPGAQAAAVGAPHQRRPGPGAYG